MLEEILKKGDNSVEEMIELAPHLFLIPGENRGRFPYAHSLYIDGEIQALIDTGAGKGLKRFSPENIDVVLFSHFHPDHVKEIDRFTGVFFWSHPASVPPLLSIEDFSLYTGLTNFREDWEDRYPLEVSILPGIHHQFRDGDVLDFGGIRLLVVHLPGHSPGHTAFFHEREGILFSGDIDLTRFGPWYGYPSSDIRAFIQSIAKVKSLNPRHLVSSHRGLIREDIGEELDSFREVISTREERILDFLSHPCTLKELQDRVMIYGELSFQMDLLYYFEGVFIEKHLESLFYRGLVRREGPYYVKA